MRIRPAATVLLLLGLSQPTRAQGQHDHIGVAHLSVSCTPVAQAQFDRALALLHNFVFPQDVAAFTEVGVTDPACAMAQWGIAMSRRANPLIGPADSLTLRDGEAAAQRAVATGAPTTRERDYIAAISEYYRDWRHRDHRTRVLAYEQAMAHLHARYPDDLEGAVFYALALDEAVTVSAPDKTYARPLEAARILTEVLARAPDHPGALHYLIHTYDYPPLAERGLAASDRYASVAPSASHALHMPSHVYSMTGRWQESIASNLASLKISSRYAHAMDFIVYAALQGAQDSLARQVMEQADELAGSQAANISPTGGVLASYSATAAIPARFALERGDWTAAEELRPRNANPVADAITLFVRAMGAARAGHPGQARADLALLDDLQRSLAVAGNEYWADQASIERTAASAWIAHAEGHDDDALGLMRSAAEREDASEKHIAMENRLWPLRELLGELLLELNRPADALSAFRTSLASARNRYRGLHGAAVAARLAGDTASARDYYRQLLQVTEHADAPRPEIAEARRFLRGATATAAADTVERDAFDANRYEGADSHGIPHYATGINLSSADAELLRRAYGIEDPHRLYASDSTDEALLKYDTRVKRCFSCYVNSYRVGFVSVRRPDESWEQAEARVQRTPAHEFTGGTNPSSTSTAELDPEVRPLAERMLKDARAAGFHLEVTATYRSPLREAFLMAEGGGRTHTLTSNHSYGRALDIVVDDGNRAHARTRRDWVAFRAWVVRYRAPAGESFRILGTPDRSWDWPHVELPREGLGFRSIGDAINRARECLAPGATTSCNFAPHLPPNLGHPLVR